jgi:AraC-like DNA-binding protein
LNLQATTTRFAVNRSATKVERSRRAKRIRRARLSYPAAFVELALLLCGTTGKREVASRLGVGISTVYRWVERHRTAWMPRDFLRTDGPLAHTTDVISALSTRCEHAGFHVSASPVNRNAFAAPTLSKPIVGGLDDGDACRFSKVAEITANDFAATMPMIRAKHAIDTKYATRLSCQRLAAIAGLARIKFIKEFASTFGVPPYHYLLGIRVKRAIELLQFSSAPLSIVAAATGFGSTASMQRSFKRFAGGTPGTVVKAIAPKRDFAFADSVDPQMFSTDKT